MQHLIATNLSSESDEQPLMETKIIKEYKLVRKTTNNLRHKDSSYIK